MRWVIDQFAASTLLGSDLTPLLVETPLTGVANIVSATGGIFGDMVVQWQLANYFDDLPGFMPTSSRLRYKSWGFRSIFLDPANQAPNGPFNAFPLIQKSTIGAYNHAGTLRGGSGRHRRLVPGPNGGGIDVQVVGDAQGTALDPALVARLGIARIR